MCNLYRLHNGPDAIALLARAMGGNIGFPEGIPNFQPRDIRITEQAPILRGSTAGKAELVQRRWSWPGTNGKPVFNFRGEGRRFAPEDRCVVVADGFYEFTAPAEPKRRKDKWLFTWPGHDWFGIAAILRSDPQLGEAFTMLTCQPGPDVAPYHNRQIVLLSPDDCFQWLDPAVDANALVQPLPAGTLDVVQSV